MMTAPTSTETAKPTIAELVADLALASQRDRLEKLIALGAPELVIEATRRAVTSLETEGVKVAGDQALLAREVVSIELRRGNGGKQYLRVETPEGPVHYYPNARHGRFIAEAQS